MASHDDIGCERRNKRMRLNNRKRLLVNEKVEVRSLEEGFLGSWHSGVVIACENQARRVQYDHVLSEDTSQSIVECIGVLPILDGLADPVSRTSRMPRGLIRPLPPTTSCEKWNIKYGLCVDAFYNDAWWEGVIFDHKNGSEERSVFFPDLGDELKISVDMLRVTLDWNEATDIWEHRGRWVFLELIEEYEQEWPLCVSIKQIWYDVRLEKGFQRIRDWTTSANGLWRYLVLKAIEDNFILTVHELLDLSDNVGEAAKSNSWLTVPDLDVNSMHELGLPDSNAIVPFKSIGDSTVGFSSINQKHRVSTKGSRKWLPVGTDMIPGAEFCPGAISEFYSKGKNTKNQNDLVTAIKQHLLYLGWTIDFSIDKPSLLNSKQRVRLRYISPDDVTYYSLRQVCRFLCDPKKKSLSLDSEYGCKSSNLLPDNHFMHQLTDNPHVTMVDVHDLLPSSDTVVVGPEYCPQAVSDWYFCRKKVLQSKYDANTAEKAKKHLAYLGWTFHYVQRGVRRELRYSSPRGKRYYSLRTACKSCMDDGCVLQSNAELQESLKMISKSNQEIRKSRKRIRPVQREVDDNNLTYVLRSSKRARQLQVPSYHNNPRTVLSCLIDNNVVLPRVKVHSSNKMAEGRITRDGIKCNCCYKVYTLNRFEAHAGCASHCPAANIILEDGRSLLECQKQLIRKKAIKRSMSEPHSSTRGKSHRRDNDYICSICHYGGDLILCDRCPSSFHKICLGLKDIPAGDWFCSSCCCRICGQGSTNETIDHDANNIFLTCVQCNHHYHLCCLRKRGLAKLKANHKKRWFCSKICSRIFVGLHSLLGKAMPVGLGLTWTLLKSMNYDGRVFYGRDDEAITETHCKLHVAAAIMHECFEPIREPHSSRDLVEDVIFSRGSHLNRLNFEGFYTVILERDDELVSVANVRVHGQKAAEVPLVATQFQYRRLGICRILINELQKRLSDIGVEKLVLPAIPSVVDIWASSFGFKRMTDAERLELLGCTLLVFPDTVMCQKPLTGIPPVGLMDCNRPVDLMEAGGHSPVSAVTQAEQIEGGGKKDQQSMDTIVDERNRGICGEAAPQVGACCLEGEQSHDKACRDARLGYGDGIHLECYKRRKILSSGGSF